MSVPDIPTGEPPHSVLLLAPGFGDGADHACSELLGASDATDVLYVGYAGDPSTRLSHYEVHSGTSDVARAVFVGEGAADAADKFETAETVSTPTDLTGIGIAVTELLADADGATTVCFDSVTSLLQYVDVDTAYEFLHVVLGRLYSHDAVGHVHMDPTAHEDDVVERMTSLVDGRLELDDDGTVLEARSSLTDW